MLSILPPIELEIYVTGNNKKPFIDWLEGIQDKQTRFRIKERLDRVALGYFGDCKLLNARLGEIRLFFGSGYRIYFGIINKKVILLLCAGNKATQKKDIKKAMKYWEDYLSR